MLCVFQRAEAVQWHCVLTLCIIGLWAGPGAGGYVPAAGEAINVHRHGMWDQGLNRSLFACRFSN